MTKHDELIEAARNAADSDLYSPSLLLRILDAVEPIIRADEATDAWAKAGAAARTQYKRDLRAQVEALHGQAVQSAYRAAIEDVLDLLDRAR